MNGADTNSEQEEQESPRDIGDKDSETDVGEDTETFPIEEKDADYLEQANDSEMGDDKQRYLFINIQ